MLNCRRWKIFFKDIFNKWWSDCYSLITNFSSTYIRFISNEKLRQRKKNNLSLHWIIFGYLNITSKQKIKSFQVTMFRNNIPSWVPIFSCFFLSAVGLVISSCLILSLIPLYINNRSVEKSSTTSSGLNLSSIESIFVLIYVLQFIHSVNFHLQLVVIQQNKFE